jgi:hypothetical protein
MGVSGLAQLGGREGPLLPRPAAVRGVSGLAQLGGREGPLLPRPAAVRGVSGLAQVGGEEGPLLIRPAAVRGVSGLAQLGGEKGPQLLRPFFSANNKLGLETRQGTRTLKSITTVSAVQKRVRSKDIYKETGDSARLTAQLAGRWGLKIVHGEEKDVFYWAD